MSKLLAVLTILGLSIAMLLWQTVQAMGDAGPIATPPTGFAVVELFTSEGCSSCPPADTVLTEHASGGRENVFPLSFHVDYWDDLGWRDPFSSGAYSARQRRHAEVLGGRRIYTPQVVINGVVETIGSRRAEIQALLSRFLAEPPTPAVAIALSVRREGERTLQVKHDVALAPSGSQLTVLLVQRLAQTHVTRGENASLELTHSNVVRAMVSRAPRGHTRLTIPDGLEASEVSVVALLERSNTLTILAAARASVAP